MKKSKMNCVKLELKLRCKVTEVKVNLKWSYDYLKCGACGLEEESQRHIIQCENFKDMHDANCFPQPVHKSLLTMTQDIHTMTADNSVDIPLGAVNNNIGGPMPGNQVSDYRLYIMCV